MAFGMGSRTCIGKHISMLEMSKLVPQLVRNFNFELDGDLQREGLKSLNRSFVKQQNFRGKVFARAERKASKLLYVFRFIRLYIHS
jgi:hypothetical protein